MNKADYFSLPTLTYDEIRKLGHKQQMGIYKPKESKYAFSIMTNAGETRQNYEDHLSDDLVLTYHGRGKKKDQTLDDYDNYALYLNFQDGVNLRVFAGSDNKYRDWGYWRLIDMSTEFGKDGFLKLVYKMIPVNDVTLTSKSLQTKVDNDVTRYAERVLTNVKRRVRYAPELRMLKEAYEYKCQVNETHDVTGRNGSKVVVHHLYPVGADGALVTPNHSNEIVLCPNCHALFDDGSLFIDVNDGVTLHHWDKNPKYENKKLRFIQGHILDREILKKVYKLHWGK